MLTFVFIVLIFATKKKKNRGSRPPLNQKFFSGPIVIVVIPLMLLCHLWTNRYEELPTSHGEFDMDKATH